MVRCPVVARTIAKIVLPGRAEALGQFTRDVGRREDPGRLVREIAPPPLQSDRRRRRRRGRWSAGPGGSRTGRRTRGCGRRGRALDQRDLDFRPRLQAPYQPPDDEPVLGSVGAVRLERHRDLAAPLDDLVQEPIPGPELGERVTAQGLAQSLSGGPAGVRRVGAGVEVRVGGVNLDQARPGSRQVGRAGVRVEVEDQAGEETPVEVAMVELQAGEAIGDPTLQPRGIRIARDPPLGPGGQVTREDFLGHSRASARSCGKRSGRSVNTLSYNPRQNSSHPRM